MNILHFEISKICKSCKYNTPQELYTWITVYCICCGFKMVQQNNNQWWYGPLTRYVTLWVAHAPGMPGTFSLAVDSKEKLTIPACITARAWRTCRDACRDRLPLVAGKTFPAFPAHAHPQFSVSGKRPMIRNWMTTCVQWFQNIHYWYSGAVPGWQLTHWAWAHTNRVINNNVQYKKSWIFA